MTKIECLQNVLESEKDCALIMSDVNRRYFTGMKSSAGILICFKSKAYLLIDFRYIEKARSIVKDCEVILAVNTINQIKELMKKHNANKIFIESEKMTVSKAEDLKKSFSEFEFDTSGFLSGKIAQMRIIKSDEDIQKIINAQRIAEKAFDHMLESIEVGRSERELALELDFFMLKNGAEALSFDTIVLTGKNTSMPHGVPSDEKVKKGDFVLMDFGAVFEGYHSDMTRTVVAGNPDSFQEEIYNIVLNAQLHALENVKSGITGSQLDRYGREIIERAGYAENFGHSLGHGVGMEIHELPNAAAKSNTVLKEGMIVTVEPGIYIPDKFGVRIEDFVCVTKNGCKNLTLSPKELISV